MTLEILPFDLDPNQCPVCGGRWVDCECDPDEADALWPEDAAMTDLRPCAACREVAPLDELTEVIEVRTGAVFWVHRASMRPCFAHKVLGADVHRLVNRSERDG